MVHIIFTSIWLNQLLPSALVVATLVGLIILENHFIKKHELNLKKTLMILIVISSFILFLCAIFLLLWIWNFDFQSYLSVVLSDSILFLEDSVGKFVSSVIILFVAQLILRLSKIALMKIGSKEGPLQRRKKTISRVIRKIGRAHV